MIPKGDLGQREAVSTAWKRRPSPGKYQGGGVMIQKKTALQLLN